MGIEIESAEDREARPRRREWCPAVGIWGAVWRGGGRARLEVQRGRMTVLGTETMKTMEEEEEEEEDKLTVTVTMVMTIEKKEVIEGIAEVEAITII